jgi:hypothetical protein
MLLGLSGETPDDAIVNEFGRRLDFEVENGLYQGRRNTMKGVVDNSQEEALPGTRANSVPGVFSVDNQLLVAKAEK